MSNPTGWLSVCETGGCLEILVQGDTVVLRETSTPDVEVVTTLASWQAWQDKARAEERAAIVAALRAEAERLKAVDGVSAHMRTIALAYWIEDGGFADVAAGDE